MTTILIPTFAEDVHASAVELVLADMGHRAVRWFTSNFPQRGSCAWEIGPDAGPDDRLSIKDFFGELDIAKVDVLWNRRFSPPVVEADIHESDRSIAVRESKTFLRGVLSAVSDSCFSVNSFRHARKAEDKLLQLRVARRAGLSIPRTLISNDPARIRGFLASEAPKAVVFKPFRPIMWKRDDDMAIAFTSVLREDQMPSDEILRLSPCIFQEQVAKAFEVRVTCMGQELVAAKLRSQETALGAIDWRSVAPMELSIEPIELPAGTRDACLRMMEELGLVFGCFDFIVKPSGEYVFLEVNQMGQFLWIEQANPDIRLLQMFCEFLAGGRPDFRRKASRARYSFMELMPTLGSQMQDDYRQHVKAPVRQNIFAE